jgi:hypothetical protein
MYHVMKFQAPFERLKEYNSSPEIILYKAIITQAIIMLLTFLMLLELKH